MNTTVRLSLLVSAALMALGSTVHAQPAPPQAPNMTFFVVSAGPGKGADLGGLEGADRQCQTLAQAAGAGGKTWRAYLSTQGAAMVGHIDRKGLRDDDASKSWNSSHPSRGPGGGCSQSDLRGTGGNGLFYCFAAN